jgi:hypothetical protein
MTSLIAWITVDSRSAASAYFASDSRITWPESGFWDHGRKLFACHRSPHILAYCGDVLFPTQTLSQITEMIDFDLLINPSDSVDVSTQKIISTMQAALQTYPPAATQPFNVLYCTREEEGMQSQFHLRQISFHPTLAPQVLSIETPVQSQLVAVLGSGSQNVRTHFLRWESSDSGGTSRAVFAAFCDSLLSCADPLSAGPPQLVGLWRQGPPRTFGVIWQQRRYFYGLEVQSSSAPSNIRWYNELFEICSPETLARCSDSQPQPRPRDYDV